MAERIPVLLVGTYHFESRKDMVTPDVVSMKTPEKQAEIADLVERLAAYAPTKVMLEAPYAMEGQLAVQYAAYRFGSYELGQNEVHQVGFRLAKRLGHDRIYGIDILHRWWEPDVEKAADANSVAGEVWERIQRDVEDSTGHANADLHGLTVVEHLAKLNTCDPDRSGLEDYLTAWVRLVDGDNYAGADVVGNWYHRNVRIYANLLRYARPDDRLLVYYGGGHVPVLRHLLEASGQFTLDDPLAYLA